MAVTSTRPMTAEEFAEVHLDVPVELVQGEIIEMSVPGMRHGVVGMAVGFLLMLWNRAHGERWFVSTEAGVLTGRDPDTVRGPDAFVIAKSRLPDQAVLPGFLELAPELCVEVLSPHDLWKDVIAKVDEYLQAGVLEVWVIDPEEFSVHVYRPDAPPRSWGISDTFSASALPGLEMTVSELFRDLPIQSTSQS